MSPDSPETRIGRLEREQSALRQQVIDLAHDVTELAPVQMAVVRIESSVEHVDREIGALKMSLVEDRRLAQSGRDAISADLSMMRREQTAGRQANRTQLIAGVVSILVALITVGGAIVAAGL